MPAPITEYGGCFLVRRTWVFAFSITVVYASRLFAAEGPAAERAGDLAAPVRVTAGGESRSTSPASQNSADESHWSNRAHQLTSIASDPLNPGTGSSGYPRWLPSILVFS